MPAPEAAEIRQSELDRTDLELIQIVLRDPEAIKWLLPRLGPSALKDAPLREILQVCYDLQNEGESPELRESHGPPRRSGNPLAGGQLDRRDRPCRTPGSRPSFRTACIFGPPPGESGSIRSCSCSTSASGRHASKS